MTWLGAEDVNRELDAVAKISATWFRVLIPWTQIETAKGAAVAPGSRAGVAS